MDRNAEGLKNVKACEASNLAGHSHGNGATSMRELPQLLDGIHEQRQNTTQD